METRHWLPVTLLILLTLTACTIGSDKPTPTIVLLDRSATGQSQSPFDDAPPTATRLPWPSPTPTRTPLMISDFWLSSPTPTVTPATAQAEVIASSLNVRQGPGVDYPIIGVALAGDKFEVVGVNAAGNWVQVVTARGELGWISGQPAYTRLTGLLSDVPVAPASPPPVRTPTTSTNRTNVASGPGGKLVFTTGSGGDLYVINANGAGLRRLTSGVIDPVVSPDGSQVAFTRWDGAKLGALFTINLDGSGERAILGDMLQPKSPTWSPDRQEIIISFQHGGLRDPEPECKNFDLDDTIRLPDRIDIIKIHVNSATGVITICFIRLEDLRWGLRQINVATGKFEDLAADQYSYNPAWDPHNAWRVIYDGDWGLMQLDVSTNNLWPITKDLRDTGPVFSPDGQKLALTYKQHDHWEVYTLDLVTGARQRLTKPPILAEPQYSSAAPAWSPDGKRIAFVTDRRGSWEIWVMNADGSEQRPLFSPEVQAQFGLEYHGMNERMLNWVE
jgi:dipeptidyl aminopeptidase/acylaminoacyl peptidase